MSERCITKLRICQRDSANLQWLSHITVIEGRISLPVAAATGDPLLRLRPFGQTDRERIANHELQEALPVLGKTNSQERPSSKIPRRARIAIVECSEGAKKNGSSGRIRILAFLQKGYAQSGFQHFIRRMQCDHSPRSDLTLFISWYKLLRLQQNRFDSDQHRPIDRIICPRQIAIALIDGRHGLLIGGANSVAAGL